MSRDNEGRLPDNLPEERGIARENLETKRDSTIRILTESFSRNLLSMEEFETRVASAESSTTGAELERLVRGLPAVSDTPKPAPRRSPSLSDRPERYLGIMSSRTLRGEWLRSTRNEVRCIMSSQVFDFRETEIPPEGVDIEVKAVMAELIVIVPPGVDVRLDVLPIMAEVKEDRKLKSARYPKGTPGIRISGVAVMSSIIAKCKV